MKETFRDSLARGMARAAEEARRDVEEKLRSDVLSMQRAASEASRAAQEKLQEEGRRRAALEKEVIDFERKFARSEAALEVSQREVESLRASLDRLRAFQSSGAGARPGL